MANLERALKSLQFIAELIVAAMQSLRSSILRSLDKVFLEGSKIIRVIQVDIIAPIAKSFSITRVAITMLVLLIVAVQGHSQDVPSIDIDVSNPTALFGNIEAIYGIMVIVGGYLTAFIPGVGKIADGTYRVLAWAVITAIGFLLFDAGSILSLSVTYAISTSLYEVVLKWFKKKPENEVAEA